MHSVSRRWNPVARAQNAPIASRRRGSTHLPPQPTTLGWTAGVLDAGRRTRHNGYSRWTNMRRSCSVGDPRGDRPEAISTSALWTSSPMARTGPAVGLVGPRTTRFVVWRDQLRCRPPREGGSLLCRFRGGGRRRTARVDRRRVGRGSRRQSSYFMMRPSNCSVTEPFSAVCICTTPSGQRIGSRSCGF